jgi:hypothetical protein
MMLLQYHLQEPYQGLCDKHKRKKKALSINKFVDNQPIEHTNHIFVEAARFIGATFGRIEGESSGATPKLDDRPPPDILRWESVESRDPEPGRGCKYGPASSSPAAILRACVKKSLASRSAMFSM